jgi:hypothetical protein
MKSTNHKTKSEELFERFCDENSIRYLRIGTKPKNGLKTPDYEVQLMGHNVIVEVKQFNPNKEDKKLIDNFLKKGSTGIHGDEPGKRTRKAIEDAMPQLRQLAKGVYPALLVLFDNIPCLRFNKPTESYNIKTAMHGLECVKIGFQRDGMSPPVVIDRGRGGKRKVDPGHNTTLSAIMTMEENGNRIIARCYHNPYASIKIAPEWIRNENTRHYRLGAKQRIEFQEWIEI